MTAIKTPGDLRKFVENKENREMQELREKAERRRQQAGIVKPADVNRVTQLIELLREVARKGWLGFEDEEKVWRLLGFITNRLPEIAAASDNDDPLHQIIGQWWSFRQYNRPRKGRPSLRELVEANTGTAIRLAEETRSLLKAKCPEMAKDAAQEMAEDAAQEKAEAAVVQPEDLRNLEVFMLLLSRAANPQVLTSRREQEIQDQASLIWERLQAIAAVEDEDSPCRELVDQWRKFYELDRPVHAPKGIHLLMETEVDGAVALAQAAHTILGFKRPDGA